MRDTLSSSRRAAATHTLPDTVARRLHEDATMKFRLKGGQHIQEDRTQAPKVKKHLDPNTGEIVTTKKYPERTFYTGDIVESDLDLAEKHGANKFENLEHVSGSEDTPEAIQAKIEVLLAKQARLRQDAVDSKDAKKANPAGPMDERDPPTKQPSLVLPPTEAPLILPTNIGTMSTKDLIAWAADNEVELHGAVKRDDIIRVLKDKAK